MPNRTYLADVVVCAVTPAFRARRQFAGYRSVTFAFAFLLTSLSPVTTLACGWWGDGEVDNDDSDVIIVGADGRPVAIGPSGEPDPVFISDDASHQCSEEYIRDNRCPDGPPLPRHR